MHRIYALAAALVAALTVAAPVAAVTATTTDSVEVSSSVTISGVPATLSYGTVAPGTTATQTVNITVAGNVSWRLRLVASPLTSGANQINCTHRLYAYDGGSLANFTTSGANCETSTMRNGAAGSTTFPVRLALSVPVATAPGTYSGTVTFDVQPQ